MKGEDTRIIINLGDVILKHLFFQNQWQLHMQKIKKKTALLINMTDWESMLVLISTVNGLSLHIKLVEVLSISW